uniref:Uncharacterized protein n=1 Tax=Cannabis sativa TaxID=3483 RepID=A0A803R046_CANSA
MCTTLQHLVRSDTTIPLNVDFCLVHCIYLVFFGLFSVCFNFFKMVVFSFLDYHCICTLTFTFTSHFLCCYIFFGRSRICCKSEQVGGVI